MYNNTHTLSHTNVTCVIALIHIGYTYNNTHTLSHTNFTFVITLIHIY